MEKKRFRGTLNKQSVYFARIDKRKARALFNMGFMVYLMPVNIPPFGTWISTYPIVNTSGQDFDELSRSFMYYNCINSETGYFPAYYIDLLSNECFKPIKL